MPPQRFFLSLSGWPLLAQALAHHKTLEHYQAWADFKASDAAPVLSQVVTKMNAVDFQ